MVCFEFKSQIQKMDLHYYSDENLGHILNRLETVLQSNKQKWSFEVIVADTIIKMIIVKKITIGLVKGFQVLK